MPAQRADRRGSPDHPLGRAGLKRPLARLCAVQPVRVSRCLPSASELGWARDWLAAVSEAALTTGTILASCHTGNSTACWGVMGSMA